MPQAVVGSGHTGGVHIVIRPAIASGGGEVGAQKIDAVDVDAVGVDAVDVDAVDVTDAGDVISVTTLARSALPAFVAAREAEAPRWVWSDSARWYPEILAAGVRIDRCVDLRLTHAILRNSTAVPAPGFGRPTAWDAPWQPEIRRDTALFDLDDPAPEPDAVTEFAHQRALLASTAQPARLGLLLAAESAGSLIAVEMAHAGLPWRADVHETILESLLGPRPSAGRPAQMENLLAQMRVAFDVPDFAPDSPAELLKGLQLAGVQATSTRSWELKQLKHPAIPLLLEYKKLARLASANGWHWLETWVHDGRFRPVYVPGGVVTGRWASDGGGALQLPKNIRGAVIADEGWTFVVADAAQLEPRVLAAMSGDAQMAKAGRAADMYEGMVSAGAVATRQQAKYGMLGAMYGGTTGESGRMLPRIQAAFPKAIALVEEAALAGERGESVSTWLGRSSPPGATASYDETVSSADQQSSRVRARGWGRFTRNFIVQGTAAEWALCWMASLRQKLWALSGSLLTDGPHLVFFLHDELIVHTPIDHADAVADALRTSAIEAGRLLFGDTDVEFAISVAIVGTYSDAK